MITVSPALNTGRELLICSYVVLVKYFQFACYVIRFVTQQFNLSLVSLEYVELSFDLF